MNIQLIFTIWNLEEGQLKQWSTWISNQFSKFGTPIHKVWIWTWKRVNLNFQSIFKIWNSYPQNLNLNLEEGQLEFPINCQNLELLSTKFEFELARGSTWISNQFLRIGTPTHKIWIWTWKRVNLNFQFMTFNELTSTIIKNWIFIFGKKITFWNFNLKKKTLSHKFSLKISFDAIDF